MDFASLLQKINTGSQIAAAAVPAIALYGTDHVAATQQVLQIAGAAVASESGDTATQNEARQSAQLAATLVPLGFQLFALFKHIPKKPKPAPAPVGVPTTTTTTVTATS